MRRAADALAVDGVGSSGPSGVRSRGSDAKKPAFSTRGPGETASAEARRGHPAASDDLPAIDILVEELCGNDSLILAIQDVVIRKLRKRSHLDGASKRKLIDKTVLEIFHKINIGDILLHELNNAADQQTATTPSFSSSAAAAAAVPAALLPAYSEQEPHRATTAATAGRATRRSGPSTIRAGPSKGASYRAPECLAPSVRRRVASHRGHEEDDDDGHDDVTELEDAPQQYNMQGQEEEDEIGGNAGEDRVDFGATQLINLRAISDSMEEEDEEEGARGAGEEEDYIDDEEDVESVRSSEAETEPLGQAEALALRRQIDDYDPRDGEEAVDEQQQRDAAEEEGEEEEEEIAIMAPGSDRPDKIAQSGGSASSYAPLPTAPVISDTAGAEGREGEEDSHYNDETWEEEEEYEREEQSRRKKRVVFHDNVISDVFLTRYKFDRDEVADLFFTVEEGYQFQVDFDRELSRAQVANKGWLEWIMERTDEEAARHEAEDRWLGGRGGGRGRRAGYVSSLGGGSADSPAEEEDYEVEELINEDEFF